MCPTLRDMETNPPLTTHACDNPTPTHASDEARRANTVCSGVVEGGNAFVRHVGYYTLLHTLQLQNTSRARLPVRTPG